MSEKLFALSFNEIASKITKEQRMKLGNIFQLEQGYYTSQSDTFIFTCDQQEFDATLIKIKLALGDDPILQPLLSKLSFKGVDHTKETQEHPIILPEGPYES